ncbi:unnamed protein product [Clonostachys rosea]|uniref:Uncharacterized protein n=1 Tax=Bionectria ochroleuca TaxID=29856 RepID=A0ABY6USJ9_BIOOC|nr:unnamed protein product [Clonostachys rosea]
MNCDSALELLLQRGGGLLGLALPNDIDAAEAPELSELDRGAADTRVGAVLDEPLPAADLQGTHAEAGLDSRVGAVVAKDAVCRARVDADSGDLERGEAVLFDLDEL